MCGHGEEQSTATSRQAADPTAARADPAPTGWAAAGHWRWGLQLRPVGGSAPPGIDGADAGSADPGGRARVAAGAPLRRTRADWAGSVRPDHARRAHHRARPAVADPGLGARLAATGHRASRAASQQSAGAAGGRGDRRVCPAGERRSARPAGLARPVDGSERGRPAGRAAGGRTGRSGRGARRVGRGVVSRRLERRRPARRSAQHAAQAGAGTAATVRVGEAAGRGPTRRLAARSETCC